MIGYIYMEKSAIISANPCIVPTLSGAKIKLLVSSANTFAKDNATVDSYGTYNLLKISAPLVPTKKYSDDKAAPLSFFFRGYLI